MENKKIENSTCLNRKQFIEASSEFIDWMVNALNEFPGFTHSWRSRSGTHKSGFKKNTIWTCSSLFSAYQQYVWPATLSHYRKPSWNGRFFDETEIILNELGNELKQSIKNSDVSKCRNSCREIFEWGGVDDGRNGSKVALGMKSQIKDQHIIEHLVYTRKYFDESIANGIINEDVSMLKDGNGIKLRMDSGTTKVYSLLCDKFVMYDGRVASALGYLVVRWFREKYEDNPKLIDFNNIPCCLRFSHDGNNKYRNPNPLSFDQKRIKIFDTLSPGNNRTQENIRVTWLLEEILSIDSKKNSSSNFSYIDPSKRLRALESALFMIGYDVTEFNNFNEKQDISSGALDNNSRKSKNLKNTTKMNCAKAVLQKSKNKSRKEIIDLFISECHLTSKGASTYYHKLK